MTAEPDADNLRERVGALRWAHCIDLGRGLVTPGFSPRRPDLEAALPDVAGRTVLDIGAYDGYYSFLSEASNAARVVALDHYAWGVDIPARSAYWDECARQGTVPDLSRDYTDFWDGALPGRKPFDLAREVLASRVEPVVADFMTMDLSTLGEFDIVLYLGVLYHMRDPQAALERVRSVTGTVAVIETEAIHLADHADDPLLRFFAGAELNRDFGNWFAPTESALAGMCRKAGFSRVETRMGPPGLPGRARPSGLRQAVAAIRGRLSPPPVERYRLTVLAYR